MVSTFTPDGYYREPLGLAHTHRGTSELRSFFVCASAQRAMEYNRLRWGSRDTAPQAGTGVYERGGDGLLTAVRVYDDVEAPLEAD